MGIRDNRKNYAPQKFGRSYYDNIEITQLQLKQEWMKFLLLFNSTSGIVHPTKTVNMSYS